MPAVSRSNDPFKKYWWVLLLVFGVVGGIICMPGMKAAQQVGAGRGEAAIGSSGSLDSAANPSGAPGGPIDLSIGAYKRRVKDDKEVKSFLFGSGSGPGAAAGAPIEEGAATTTAAAPKPGEAASASSAASKDLIAKKPDPTGWDGKTPQKGFTPPKGKFGAMGGLGGGGGGGGTSASMGAFGSRNANPGVTTASGLGGGSGDGPGKGGRNQSLNSLRGASGQAIVAAKQQNQQTASQEAQRSFDGTGATNAKIAGGPTEGLNTSFAPINLKEPEVPKDVAGTAVEEPKAKKKDKKGEEEEAETDWGNEILKIVIQTVVGGGTNAFVGAAFGASAQRGEANDASSGSD